MAGRLEGKTVLVTGAGSAGDGTGWGNGKASAVLFAREGAQVFLVDRSEHAVAQTEAIIRAEGGRCQAWTADVSDSHSVSAMVAACVTAFGTVDVLHNNVGILSAQDRMDATSIGLGDSEWQRLMSVNVGAAFYCCREVVPIMAAQRSGSVINVSSISGLRSLGGGHLAYPASKAALNQLTRVLAVQYGPSGVRFNTIVPGFIRTPMVEQLVPAGSDPAAHAALRARREATIPLRRLGDAWDIANAALFLASDESSYVTGHDLVVDGGATQQVAYLQ